MPDFLAAVLPVLVVASTAAAMAVARSVCDEAVAEGLRAEIRLLGETHRAVVETRAQRADRPPRS